MNYCCAKENEISAAKDLLLPVYLKGRIFTGDAMHTQKDHCMRIHGNGGAYSLIVKKNHPVMWEDLHLFFEDKEAERGTWKTAKEVEKGHGRICTREITVTTDLVPLFSKEWPAIAQVFRNVAAQTRVFDAQPHLAICWLLGAPTFK